MSSGLIPLIKQVAIDAMDNNQMCDLRFGKVVSENPLKIKVTDNFTIPEELLIVPRHLTDYTVRVNFSWESEEEDTSAGQHTHQYVCTGVPAVTTVLTQHTHITKSENDNEQTKELKVLNHLRKDEQVVLLRKQGGQHFYVLDRVGDE